MQIYGENNADEHSVEMMFSYEELKELVIALSEFEHQIAQYKKDNSGMEAWSYEETQKNLQLPFAIFFVFY